MITGVLKIIVEESFDIRNDFIILYYNNRYSYSRESFYKE